MKNLLRVLVILLLLVAAAAVLVFGFAPGYVARTKNVTLNPPPYPVSTRAAELHQRLLIADLHSDSLLWNYDLNDRRDHNHEDVPRLIEGNVALQAFTVVTKTPRAMNIDRNSGETDNIFWLALAQRQPFENLSSLTKRALWQAARLHDYAAASGGKLTVIRSGRDLTAFLERRKPRWVEEGERR